MSCDCPLLERHRLNPFWLLWLPPNIQTCIWASELTLTPPKEDKKANLSLFDVVAVAKIIQSLHSSVDHLQR